MEQEYTNGKHSESEDEDKDEEKENQFNEVKSWFVVLIDNNIVLFKNGTTYVNLFVSFSILVQLPSPAGSSNKKMNGAFAAT